jgi:hypothetical protein
MHVVYYKTPEKKTPIGPHKISGKNVQFDKLAVGKFALSFRLTKG